MENTIDNKNRFCKFCGNKIYEDSVMCPACGRQVEELKISKGSNEQQSIIINNNNNNNNMNAGMPMTQFVGRQKNKWITLLCLLFFGFLGGHKFYEGRIIGGILYIAATFLTMGVLTGILCFVDFFIILSKPNPYYL